MRSLSGQDFLRYGSWFVLTVWLLLTVAAIGGMYHLWWSRERILYMGKDLHEQRIELFRRSGIAEPLLDAAEVIMRSWPQDVRYSVKGNHNQLSYIKYLLIPRIPGNSTEYSIEENQGRLLFHPVLSEKVKSKEHQSSPRGLMLSLFFLAGIVFLLRLVPSFSLMSIPEYAGMALFVLAALVMSSRYFLNTATMGFWFITIAGIVGWITQIPSLHTVWSTYLKKVLQVTRSPLYETWGNRKISLLLSVFPVVFGTAVAFWCILMSVVVVPDDWDAWAIWGAKAKVLALGWGSLRDVTAFGHPDYPLLWPAVWAFAGWCSGGWEEHWSRAWGPIFMILSAGQIGVVIRRLTGQRGLGGIGAALFLSMPMVPVIASWSYAEAPLWLFVTCAFGRLFMWQKEKVDHHLLIAALFAVAAAFTKNEGLFFSAVCFVWLIATAPKNLWIFIRWYALPVFLLYLPWFVWVRGVMQYGSWVFDPFKGGMLTAMRVLERLPDVLWSIGLMWLDVTRWNLVLWLVLTLSVWHLLRDKVRRMDLFVPLMMLLSFLAFSMIHAKNYAFIINSWDRLTVQTLPLFLISFGVNYLPAILGTNHSKH